MRRTRRQRIELGLVALEQDERETCARLEGYGLAVAWADAHGEDDAYDRAFALVLLADAQLAAIRQYRAELDEALALEDRRVEDAAYYAASAGSLRTRLT